MVAVSIIFSFLAMGSDSREFLASNLLLASYLLLNRFWSQLLDVFAKLTNMKILEEMCSSDYSNQRIITLMVV